MQALQDTLLFFSFIIISHVNLPTLKNDRFVYQSQQQVDPCSGHKKSNKTYGGRETADFFEIKCCYGKSIKTCQDMRQRSYYFLENNVFWVTH